MSTHTCAPSLKSMHSNEFWSGWVWVWVEKRSTRMNKFEHWIGWVCVCVAIPMDRAKSFSLKTHWKASISISCCFVPKIRDAVVCCSCKWVCLFVVPWQLVCWLCLFMWRYHDSCHHRDCFFFLDCCLDQTAIWMRLHTQSFDNYSFIIYLSQYQL